MKRIFLLFILAISAKISFSQTVLQPLGGTGSSNSIHWFKGVLRADSGLVISDMDTVTAKVKVFPPTILSFNNNLYYFKENHYTEIADKEYVNNAIQPFINVKEYGALGDGISDDTEAIRAAFSASKVGNIKRVYFPTGVFMVSKTLYLSTDTEYFGEGMNNSIIRVIPGSSLDTIVPVYNTTGGTLDRVKFKPIIATSGADENQAAYVKNIKFHDIGLDYNNNNSGTISSTAMIIGRAKNCHIYNVRFFPVLAGDVNSSPRKLGSCLLFAFSEECSLSGSFIEYSEYESVSCWYISKNIHIYRNTFDIDKPDISGAQDHAVQIARPSQAQNGLITKYGEDISGPVYIYNNDFLLRDNVLSAITSHFSTGMKVYNNSFKTFNTNRTQVWGVKPFAGSNDFEIINNTFDFTEQISSLVGINDMGLTVIGLGGTNASEAECNNGIISGNYIKIRKPSDTLTTVNRPLIGSNATITNNVLVSNNTIIVTDYNNKPVNGIAVYGDNITISNNKILYSNPSQEISLMGPRFISVRGGKNISVSNNISSGDSIGSGIIFDSLSVFEDVVLSGNIVTNTIGTKITQNHTHQSSIKNTILKVNGNTGDQDGNVVIVDSTLVANSYNYAAPISPYDGFYTRGGYASNTQFVDENSSVLSNVEHIIRLDDSPDDISLSLPDPEHFENRLITISNNNEGTGDIIFSGTFLPHLSLSQTLTEIKPMGSLGTPEPICFVSIKSDGTRWIIVNK